MTTNDYERALSRAHDAGLRVMGKGEWTNGAAFYVVTSASEAGRFHLVTVHAGRLSCDCRAGVRGLMCQHRALAHEAIEREAIKAAVTAGFEDAQRQAREKRETAMLADRGGFSIWASR